MSDADCNQPTVPRNQLGAKIRVRSEPYSNIDAAAMDAAVLVYDRSKDGRWRREFGMAIFGDRINFRDSTKFRLGKIREGKDDDRNGTNQSTPMGEDMENPISNYYFNGFVHSHPASPPIVGYYEHSAADYYNASSYCFNSYLVLNLGGDGMLINFVPPQPTEDGRYREAMDTLHEESKKELTIRSTYVKMVKRLLTTFRGELKGTYIKEMRNDNCNIDWDQLDPAALRWTSDATTFIIEQQGEKGRESQSIEVRGAYNVESARSGEKRPSSYDLRKTIIDVRINDRVTIIGENAFAGFDALRSAMIESGNLVSISDGAFSGCKKLEGITIPSTNLTGIGAYAFSGCTNLTRVATRSNKLEIIGAGAFFGCTNLINVNIQNCSHIDNDAFSGCTNLTSVVIKCGIIGQRAFLNCANLMFITCLSSIQPNIEVDTFYGLHKNACLYVPKEYINNYHYGYNNKDINAKWHAIFSNGRIKPIT